MSPQPWQSRPVIAARGCRIWHRSNRQRLRRFPRFEDRGLCQASLPVRLILLPSVSFAHLHRQQWRLQPCRYRDSQQLQSRQVWHMSDLLVEAPRTVRLRHRQIVSDYAHLQSWNRKVRSSRHSTQGQDHPCPAGRGAHSVFRYPWPMPTSFRDGRRGRLSRVQAAYPGDRRDTLHRRRRQNRLHRQALALLMNCTTTQPWNDA